MILDFCRIHWQQNYNLTPWQHQPHLLVLGYNYWQSACFHWTQNLGSISIYPIEEPVETHQYRNPIATKNLIIIPLSWGSSFRVSSPFQRCGNMPGSIIRYSLCEVVVLPRILYPSTSTMQDEWYSKHIVVIMINFLRRRWHACILAWHCKSQIALRTRFLCQGHGASSDSAKLDCKNTIPAKRNWMHWLANRTSRHDGCLFTHNALSEFSRHPVTTPCWCRIGY